MININFIGRLAANAEVKKSSKGTEYVSFRIATDDYSEGKKGTAWFNAISSTPQSLRIAKFLTKGSMIHVHGTETIRIYTNKLGEPAVSRDILVTSFDFVNTAKPKDGENKDEDATQTETKSAEQPEIHVPVTPTPAPSVAVSTTSYQPQEFEDLPF